MIKEDVLTWSSVARLENTSEIKTLKKRQLQIVSDVFFLPFDSHHKHAIPSPEKSGFRHLITLHLHVQSLKGKKNAAYFVLVSWKWQRKRFQCLVTCCCVTSAMSHTKGKCESGEICPVKTNAIVQHFGKTSSGYAWQWSPIAEKDEVKEGATKGWYGGYGPQSLLKEEFDSGHTFF